MSEPIIVGRTIISMQIADDKKALLFKTDGGDVVVKVDGDCCSETWIEHVELPALGFPAVVHAADDLDLPQPEQDDDYDCIAYYGCKISTDRGDIVIDYRNSSNGYYGGSLSWPDDGYYYGGVSGQNISTCKWVDIREN